MTSEPLRLREENLEWREVEGEVIVLDLDGSVYMSVNGTGATCWRALAEGATRADLVRLVTEHYEVDEARADRDIDVFLSELSSRGLLVRSP